MIVHVYLARQGSDASHRQEASAHLEISYTNPNAQRLPTTRRLVADGKSWTCERLSDSYITGWDNRIQS